MARIKKAKKMIKVHERKRQRNIRIKSEVKSRVKNILCAPGESNQDVIRLTIKRADQAATKKIIHKNKAARIKSKLMKKLHKSTAVSV